MDKADYLKKYKFTFSLILILDIMLFILNPFAGLIGVVISVLIGFELIKKEEWRETEEIKDIENLYDSFDSAAQDSVFNMAFPLIMTDDDGVILWYNPAFLKVIGENTAVGEDIDSVIKNFSFENYKNLKDVIEIDFGGTFYRLFKNKVVKTNGNTIYLFYFIDNTDYNKLNEKYLDNKIGFGHLYIDNYDEVGLGRKSYEKSVIMADIENAIMNYFRKFDAIVRKYDDDKYLIVFNHKTYDKMISDRFSILDIVRELEKDGNSNITLSMGVSETSDSIPDSYEESRIAVDLALSRGGDQVVVRNKSGHEFFGGRSQAKEKRNKVKVRVIGNTLGNLVDESSEVFIMGHSNADMDAIGSSIGMLGAVRRRGKNAYIVLNEINPSIELIMRRMKEVQPESFEYIISSERAFELSRKTESLIIMLDHHNKSFSEEPKLYDKIDKVVVIDHHRRSQDAIENAVLSYIESYASSTSELVTEILEYMDSDMNITEFEAEAMLAGIVVDTKNFSYQTGVRTFDASAILRRHGANPTNVNKFFNDNFDTVKARAKVIEEAVIIRGEIAISKLSDNENKESNILIAAQAADSLLNVIGIKASFVLTDTGKYIHVSARSSGDISVQLIMEKIGGGGHLVSAASQLYNVTMDEAVDILVDAIEQYYKDIEIENQEKENRDESNID